VNSAITDTGLFVFTRGIPATRSLNRIYGNSLRSEYLIDDVAISATGQYFSYLKERKFGDSLYFDDSLLIYSATERDLVAAFPMGYRQKHFFSNDDSLLLLTDEKGEWTVHDVFRRKQVAGFKNLKFDYLVQMNPAKTEYLLFTSDGKLKVMDFMQNTVLLDTLLAPDPYDELNSDFYKSELETAYADFSGDGKRMIVKLDFYDNQYDNILVYATNPYRLLNTVCDTTLKKTCNLPGNMIINSNGTTIFSVKDNSEIEKTDLRTGKIQVGPGNSGSYEPIVSESFKKSSYSDNKIDENDTRHFSLSSTGKWLYLLNGVSDVERKMSYQLQVFATADLKLHKEYLFLPGTTDISYYLEYLDTANRAIITTEAPMYTIESFSVGDNASGDPEGAILTNNRGDAFYFNLEKRVERAPDSFYNSMSPVFSPDRKLLVTFRGYGYAQVYNWAQGKQLATLEGHDGRLRSFRLSNDKIYGCSKSDDGSFTIWKMPTLSGEKPAELLFRSFQFSNGGFITTDKEGYYICSKNAMEELYFRKNLQTISFSQLDLEYNRPDKVLRSIGCPDTMLVHAYQKAWTKRLASLEIDSSVFSTSHSIPRCAITNAKTVPALQHNKNLVLQISAGDSSALQLFNIRVNEIPVFGSKGIKIQGARHTFDTSVTIQLSEGRNFIEASVMNQFGMESYRSPLVVNYDSDNDSTFTEKKYFIGIGIDRFTQSQYNLRYSAKDIRRLSEELSALGYETLDTLFDEQVTVENIGRLKQKLAHTTVHDKIIIAYSGHGLLDNNYDYYLSTWNVNFDAPEQNGLPYRKLEDLLDGIPSRQKLLLLDACHSGEVDKEEFERIRNVSIQADKKSTIIISPRTKTRVGLKNSIELMQDLFGNGGRNIGATIIAAAGGAQYALERQDLEHGVFTFAFIAALYEGLITINELKAFVSKYVLELSRGVQRPTTRSETSMVNWKL
jgi:WD40 repeat protein